MPSSRICGCTRRSSRTRSIGSAGACGRAAPPAAPHCTAGPDEAPADRPIDTRIAPAQNKNKSQDADGDTQGPSQDTRSLAGAEEFSLGPVTQRRSFWQPLIGVTSTVDTNPLASAATQTTNVTTWSS